MSVSSAPGGRRHTIDESALGVTSVLAKRNEHAVVDHELDEDEKILVALGYKQEFKRDFSIWTCFSVSFSILGILPSIASTLAYNLAYSGPAGSIWGWIVASVLIQFVALSMAELCSSMPTAGGLYYASAVLAPEGWGPFAAWVTGWSNFLGQLTGPVSVGYALSYMILTAAAIGNPDYVIQTWHIYLTLLLVLIVSGLITMQSTKIIGYINVVGVWVNLVALIIFVIWMPVGSVNTPKTNPNWRVWTAAGIENGTEWPTGFAFIMGFLSVIWTMSGYDAPFHLSEECSNANVAAPRAIVMTSQLGFYLGFPVIIAIAYTVTSVEDVVASELGQPFGALCLQVLGTKAGLAMFAINMVAQWAVELGCIIAGSRVIYAYSRDDALPGSRWWKQVNKHTMTPVNALWFDLSINALLGLLMFASPVAIGAVFSIGAIAQYTAFTIPIALRLTAASNKFRPGPWNLGRWSKPCGYIACTWVVFIIPVLCFPSVKGGDLNDLTMNYTCLIYGGVMLFALLWYAIDARKWFKGPKINVEHIIHGQDVDDREDMVRNTTMPQKEY
ncbi:hypothetical protein BAUCODRAFT_31527 [Baudoinia panamericana UAMH 10762]|uniref:Amino acid permease/ SLC12A domain-containing protein n=1 Tax=Baudoinia panamericana (strain UAMH 10762) TaxID=717646 RepID=M2N593_BAUPA|nr:uncharacterized protein BAUCODRAFT_31527 [Baudoinia panamericana UAMH 10762]EMC99193.1 hypothetical protein BAUCODRAFT_31527 [Baudoinia panamericana UAMH 10762]